MNELQCDLSSAQLLLAANHVAHRHRHHYIGTQHLLMAMYDLQDGWCLNVFQRAGISRSDLRKKARLYSANPKVPIMARFRLAIQRAKLFLKCGPRPLPKDSVLPLTPVARRIVEKALELRHSTDLPYGSLHFLLAVLGERSGQLLMPSISAADVLQVVREIRGEVAP